MFFYARLVAKDLSHDWLTTWQRKPDCLNSSFSFTILLALPFFLLVCACVCFVAMLTAIIIIIFIHVYLPTEYYGQFALATLNQIGMALGRQDSASFAELSEGSTWELEHAKYIFL